MTSSGSPSSWLADVLADEGHHVLIATNGQQALERASKQRPSLVLTDFVMPVMDGAALMKAMAADPALSEVPVVVMSSSPEAVVAERCRGYVAFVRKPFKCCDVVALVATLCRP